MKANEKRDLKLMEWAKAHFPPIDLNENVKYVLELIAEIERLRKQLNHESK